MKHVIRKLFFDFEKEEKWINDLALKGLNFTYYSPGKYIFEEGESGEYIYRLELLNNLPSHPESVKYIRFMEDMGVECVATYIRWVYFRKKASEGAFDLFSDYDSRIKHYKKVASFVGVIGAFNLAVAIYNLVLGLKLGHNSGFYFNAYISTLNWIVGAILISLLATYFGKIRKMKKERQLYE